MRFFDWLFPLREDERVLRAMPAGGLIPFLEPHAVGKTIPPSVALLPFRERSVRAALHEAKYHGSEHAFGLLAEVLAAYLRELDLTRAARLIALPLGKARRRARTFNQVEEIARRALARIPQGAAGPRLELEAEALARVRETEPQTSLRLRERKENMRGAFQAVRKADPAYLYILLDDVLTTGATLEAAAKALAQAGATDIVPLALAH